MNVLFWAGTVNYKVNNSNSNKLWMLDGQCHIVVILSV